MSMYQHILLATDLGEESKNVAQRAVELAKQFSCQLSVIHTIEPIPAYGYPEVTELRSPFIDKVKNELLRYAKDLNLKEENLYIEFGSVKATVIAKADELGADVIVVGSHGRYGLSRLLGSSASGIVHSAHCDVFVIRCSDNES